MIHGLRKSSALNWFPEYGVGYFPVQADVYDLNYWAKYIDMDSTEVGQKLTDARVDLVKRFWDGDVVDVGIGGGKFCRECPANGFDVNPYAVEWLNRNRKYVDPWNNKVEAATFWDSLEHIQDPSLLINNVDRFIFASIPIFEGGEDILKSKHFRKDEHFWYFTVAGFEWFMKQFGFELRHFDTREQDLGREAIGSFAFERMSDGS